MVPKDLKIDRKETISVKEAVKATKIESMIQPPDQKPIFKDFSFDSSSEEIVAGTIREIQEAGYRLEPKTLDILVRSVDDIKDLGIGFKVAGNLSVEGGGGGSFEKSPKKANRNDY